MVFTWRRHGVVHTVKARVVQGSHGKYRMEYELPVEANGRIVTYDGETNWQYDPTGNSMTGTSIPATPGQMDSEVESLIKANYTLSLAPERARVADRKTYVLDLTPKCAGKSSQRRWIDCQTFKTLRIETHYTDGILAQMVAYTDIQFPTFVNASEFKAVNVHGAKRKPPIAVQSPLRTRIIPSKYVDTGLNAQADPGFSLVQKSTSLINGQTAEHFLYSDGIETVSVFVQRGASGPLQVPSNWRRIELRGRSAFENLDGHLDAITWNNRGFRFTAVSHLTPEALKQFAQSEVR